MNQHEPTVCRELFFGSGEIRSKADILSCNCGKKFSADPVKELFYPDLNNHDRPCGIEDFLISGYSDGFHQLKALIPKCPYCASVLQRHKYTVIRSVSAHAWFQRNTFEDVTKEYKVWLAEYDERRKDLAFLKGIGDNTNRIGVLQGLLESRPPESSLLLHARCPEREDIYSNLVRRSWKCKEEEFIWRISWLWSTPTLLLSDRLFLDNIDQLISLTLSIGPRGGLIFLADLNRQMGEWEKSHYYLKKFDLTVEYNILYLRVVRLYIELFIKLRFRSRILLDFSVLKGATLDDAENDEDNESIQFNVNSLINCLSKQGLEVDSQVLSDCQALTKLIRKTSLHLPYFK